MVTGDGAFLHGNKEVSRFGEGGVGLDCDTGGSFDGDGVDFASVGLEGTYQVEVSAGTEVFSVEERGGI